MVDDCFIYLMQAVTVRCADDSKVCPLDSWLRLPMGPIKSPIEIESLHAAQCLQTIHSTIFPVAHWWNLLME
jgi:hypothetical protein